MLSWEGCSLQAIRKLNNNAVVCIDSNGSEIIALGKGIGFSKMPCEISISQIERSFYNIDPNGQNIMKDLPSEVVLLTAKIIDIASHELPYELSPNAVLLLSDHIAFAIERTKKKMNVKMPLYYDIRQMYPLEYKIGEYILKRIQKEFNIVLPKEEIAAMAMNIVNAKAVCDDVDGKLDSDNFETMLEEITEIIEYDCHLMISRESFDFARFATHLEYLFRRIKNGQAIDTDNVKMHKILKEEYPEISKCVEHINEHILKAWNVELTEEEKLYLILHVNRICVKEGL